jgi:hypothetical protein
MNSWSQAEAERAFSLAARARRRARMVGRLRRGWSCGQLPVFDQQTTTAGATGGVREIPLEAIAGTLEPNRAAHFDCAFRPAARTRGRWLRVWLAEHGGAVLPPISVVPVGDGFAIRDGHHRVSVARARGALTIDAVVAA